MEQLPQTKDKGVFMFVQRRQRIDDITAEQEDLRTKGMLVEAAGEPEIISPSRDHQNQPQVIHQKNGCLNGLDSCHISSASKPLVSNRTAKPFLVGPNQFPRPFSPVRSPTTSSANIFKVPVPVHMSPQVWSPTGDVIASRDERIVVPAIKTGTLPELKRRGTSKNDLREPPEDDCFGLGAEACNFMQTPTVRQKNPPKVLPKPTINPACPPWSAEGHSPVSSSPLPGQGYLAPPQPHPTTKLSIQQEIRAQAATVASSPQSKLPWIKPQRDTGSVVSCPPQRWSSYHHAAKDPPISQRDSKAELDSSDGAMLKGKGAELFARRQSRMEKFVVDAQTVQANRANSPSPTLSMPSAWKYSSIVRAPPPVSYNPTVSPFYPLAAQKQPPQATSTKTKLQEVKEKPKQAPNHLSVMDVMKHQPYQLDSSLFTYGSSADLKGASTKTSQTPPPEGKQPLTHLQSPSSDYFRSPTFTPSPAPSSGSVLPLQQGAKPSGPVSVPFSFTRLPAPAEASAAPHGRLPAPQAMRDGKHNTFSAPSAPAAPSSTTQSHAFISASSFPLSSEIISRCALPIAPRPKFCAKKPAVVGKQWKRVVMQH